MHEFFFEFFSLRSSIGGVAYVTVFNSSATWAATIFHLWGYKCMLVIFSWFHNPPNSDMDWRIFNVRAWSLVCVRIHIEVGHTDGESAQPF